MQSTNYIIDKDSINFGGSEESESESYKLSDTMGEIGTGESEEKCAAMSFDGVDDYINVGTDSSLNTGAYETVSAWVKRDDQLELYGGIYSDGGTDRRILISSSVLLAQYKIGGIVYSASVSSSYIPFGVWTHTVFTYDGTEICLWVNGVKRASTPATGIIRNPYQFFRIGWGHNETYHFTGSIDDVRIYNRALSADEISDLYNGNQIDDAGLVGYWGFDEGIGSTTADLSGNGNTGTIDGATFTGDTPSATCSILNAGYRQDDTFISTISISSPDDVILGPSFGGILGGTGTGSADWTVTTDDPAGYQVSIKATTTPALIFSAYSFADYMPGAGTPDYDWTVTSSASEFGYSVEGTHTVSKFLDNGTACDTGSGNVTDKCWLGFSTSDESVATSSSPNDPTGTATTIKFRAEAGNQRMQQDGTYVATIVVTAVAL